MKRFQKKQQIQTKLYKQFVVRMEDGNTYFVPAYTVHEAKSRVSKYFPSQYCIDDKPNFVDLDDCDNEMLNFLKNTPIS